MNIDTKEVIREWLRHKGKEISDDHEITLVASESRVWSEYTSEDFSVTVSWGEDYYYMDETEVVEFLNWMATE